MMALTSEETMAMKTARPSACRTKSKDWVAPSGTASRRVTVSPAMTVGRRAMDPPRAAATKRNANTLRSPVDRREARGRRNAPMVGTQTARTSAHSFWLISTDSLQHPDEESLPSLPDKVAAF